MKRSEMDELRIDNSLAVRFYTITQYPEYTVVRTALPVRGFALRNERMITDARIMARCES